MSTALIMAWEPTSVSNLSLIAGFYLESLFSQVSRQKFPNGDPAIELWSPHSDPLVRMSLGSLSSQPLLAVAQTFRLTYQQSVWSFSPMSAQIQKPNVFNLWFNCPWEYFLIWLLNIWYKPDRCCYLILGPAEQDRILSYWRSAATLRDKEKLWRNVNWDQFCQLYFNFILHIHKS